MAQVLARTVARLGMLAIVRFPADPRNHLLLDSVKQRASPRFLIIALLVSPGSLAMSTDLPRARDVGVHVELEERRRRRRLAWRRRRWRRRRRVAVLAFAP